jgi:BlaI family transcriptional regulator, penicillinase repressor
VPEPAVPTPREMEILKVLWEHGPSSVRDVYRFMAEHEDLAYNTVQTMLRIMEDKGLVRHHVDGRAFVYKAIYTREASVRGFLDRVFDGAADELVLTLLRTERVSPDELDRLHSMIQEARKRKAGR